MDIMVFYIIIIFMKSDLSIVGIINHELHIQKLFLFSVFDTPQCIKSRTVLGIMGFLGFANVYAMRVNLSVAIVAMVNSSSNADVGNNSLDVCPALDPIDNSTIPTVLTFFDNIIIFWMIRSILTFSVLRRLQLERSAARSRARIVFLRICVDTSMYFQRYPYYF